MRLNELNTIKSFADAAKDAEPRGLTVGKWGNRTAVWVTKRHDFFRAMGKKGFPTNNVNDVITIKNVSDYRKAVATLTPLTNEAAFEKFYLDLNHEKAYNDLQQYLADAQGKFPVGSLQLFIPRPSIHNKKDDSWLYKDYSKEDIEEDAPILIGKVDSGGGYNKPAAALWTSTLKKAYTDKEGHTYYSSEWNQWLLNSAKSWWSEWGYVYQVKSNARILSMSSAYEAEHIYKLYKAMHNKPVDLDPKAGSYETPADLMKRDYPWNDIAKHWDGVHGGYHYRDEFFYGWDCESTAWFDPAVLVLKGKVRVSDKPNSDSDD
jgi:hypothetical protein